MLWRKNFHFLLLFIGFHVSAAERVKVAVASNFIKPMKALVAEFEQQSDIQVVASYGSSGKLFSQITYGAPYDIFFSADQEKVTRLIEQKLAVDDFQFTYAVGALALWTADKSTQENLLTRLKAGQFNKLAMANPKLAPYGLAAKEVIAELGLTTDVANKLVLGENISQSYQFVATGNAELGFVALSQLTKKNDAWLVPSTMHSPIKQQAVLLNNAKNKTSAKAFLIFMQSDSAQSIIKHFGYQPFIATTN